jgi:hypothetical protein
MPIAAVAAPAPVLPVESPQPTPIAAAAAPTPVLPNVALITNGKRSYVSVASISTSSDHLMTQHQYLALIRPSDYHKFSYHGEVIGSFD